MKVVVIIPTYNEKENIQKLVPILEDEIFPQIKSHSMHILIVDDNSPDGTADAVRDLAKKYDNIKLNEGKKEGLGAAYVRGMNYAIDEMKADVVFEFDADLSHDPTKIPDFLKKIEEGYDMVIGTRYSQGGSIPKDWGIVRKLLSVAGNLTAKMILMRFWIHDWTGGFRALKKEVFVKEKEGLKKYKGYTFQIAFLHKAVHDGYKIAEVPFDFKDRTLGKSKIPAMEYIFDSLKYLIVARTIELYKSPFMKYAFTGFVGYLINAISLEVFFHAGFHPAVAGAIGAELAIIWNFTVNNFWAFGQYRITNPWKILVKFPQFNLVSIGSLLIISTVLYIGTHLFGEQYRQLYLIVAIGFFVIPYSYTMYNIFIWKRWHISALAGLQKKLG